MLGDLAVVLDLTLETCRLLLVDLGHEVGFAVAPLMVPQR